jgi:hypothetical protein
MEAILTTRETVTSMKRKRAGRIRMIATVLLERVLIATLEVEVCHFVEGECLPVEVEEAVVDVVGAEEGVAEEEEEEEEVAVAEVVEAADRSSR